VQQCAPHDAVVNVGGPSLITIMAALLAVHLAGMGAFLTVPVLAPAIAAETGLPASLAGIHTALVYAGALLSGPLTGPLVRRHGGVRVLQAGLVLIGCGIALAAVGAPWALAASAVLAGIGHGPVTPGSSHVIAARTPPRRRALVFSLKQAGVPAGAMAVAAAAPAIAAIGGWRAGVLAVAASAFVVALAMQPIRAALDADRDPGAGAAGFRAIAREAGGSLGRLRSDAALRHLTIMACGYGVAQFCFLTFFVAFQVGALGTPLAEAGLRLAYAQAAGVLGRVAWAVAADRGGAHAVLIACGLGAAAAGLALAAAGPGWPGAIVILAGIVMGATAVGWNGVMLAEAARIAPQGQVGATTAALSFAFGITMLIAPPAFTGLVELTGGYAAGFLMCVLATLAGAVAIATSPRR
jgi:predicted MFS family arabinose efflux permease